MSSSAWFVKSEAPLRFCLYERPFPGSMSAQSLTAAVTLFESSSTPLQRAPIVNESISFRFVLDGTIQTLSTNNSPDQDSISGLLFVPSLDPEDPCNNVTAPFVPRNVTRETDLPDLGYDLIGLAPWVSIDCTESYLASARNAPASALVFYRAGSHDTSKPPPISDAVWTLNDGGAWRKNNPYPVYAIPGPAGNTLMNELAKYSGNTTNPESTNSSDLSNVQSSTDFARLYGLISLKQPKSSLPSLWVFILAILGVLAFVVILSIVAIRIIQSRRRESLRRRIEAGEVDIESLGIKRMKVPREILDKIPVYTYPALTPPPKALLSDEQTLASTLREKDDDASAIAPAMPRFSDPHMSCSTLKDFDISTIELATIRDSITDIKTEARLTFSQPTCAICLDDFIPGCSVVRELPCAHIFHPECVDAFLMKNSSLCPMCKKSVLPPDFCPTKVTNLMETDTFSAFQARYRHRNKSAFLEEVQHRIKSRPAGSNANEGSRPARQPFA
ncbi:RING finger domain protein, putative [Paecilomyces variotii No. 5]|uniref:RING finger domain protein, putative n=1 Tax=Byssochlamys spectabilis (strain No. 5 / NBRC 109023) TaxID=1356009 RepID=V5FW09_BYSSN|nr:RING finger domain protein, putative [Paecilomyces variotii No. 5]